jgi:hypothetical protein
MIAQFLPFLAASLLAACALIGAIGVALYRSEFASPQVNPAPQQQEKRSEPHRDVPAPERLNAETLTRELAAAARTAASDLEAAQRKSEALTAAAQAAASEAAQAKETAERSATAEKALPQERARADALARDLETAQRKIEALTAAAQAATRPGGNQGGGASQRGSGTFCDG